MRALKTHTTEFPPTKKPKARALPAWQVELSGAVNEMEGYSQGELAGGNGPELDED